MKKIVFILLLFLGLNTFGQNKYFIIKVEGEVKNLSTGLLIKQGDVINKSDLLSFETKKSKIMLISDKRDKFLIKRPKKVKENEEFVAGDIALAVKSRAAFASRSGGALDEPEVTDLKSYFGEDEFTIIGDNLSVPLNTGIYPLNNNEFIVFYYNIGEEPVTKKIGFNQNILNIERQALMKAKQSELEDPEINNLTVYRYTRDSQQTDFITEFTLNFVDREAVISEFKTLIPILKSQEMDRSQIKNYMQEYYFDFYGITDKKFLEKFTEDILTEAGI